MKWRVVKKPEVDYSQWQPLFAWKPTRVGKNMLWLETIYRRAIFDDHMFLDVHEMNRWIVNHGDVEWEYSEGVLYP